MTEEATIETNTNTAPPVADAPEQASTQPEPDRKTGREAIDFDSASPDEIKSRFNNIYGQMQRQDRALREYRGIAQTQSEKIAELMNATSTVVDHLQTEKFSGTEESLRQQMQSAHERGDSRGFLEAQEKLMDVRLEKRLFEKEQKNRQPQAGQQAQQNRTPSAMEAAEQAAASGEIGSEDVRGIDAWQSERDASGSLLRPWAHNKDTNNPDPQYIQALMESRAVFANSRFSHLSTEQKLAEVDRRMGVQVRQSSQSVMGANLTNGKRSSKITLSPKQEEIALKTKFGGPKAKSDAEHIEAYRKQIELVSKKGARQ